MSKLLIVESPAKARTIAKFLGRDFKVVASMGHVRDLPKSKIGIDIEHDFEPTYVIPPKAKSVLQDLKNQMKSADVLYLATDPDREGEAIAWHLKEALHPKITTRRITFHEISKAAVDDAIKNSRDIDLKLVDSQAARRILDRLVGYTLSPLLWRKVAPRLSAGRVQSVAVRLIVEREREIKAFKAIEYWSLIAHLEKPGEKPEFDASLVAVDGKQIERTKMTEKIVREVEKAVKGAKFVVKTLETKEVKRSPGPPFTTSTLQQEAYRKLGYSAKRTMSIAQKLYEEGLITYMRTDSLNLSKGALDQAKEVIAKEFGAEYVPAKSRYFKNSSKNAQEAHEAIRPVNLSVRHTSLKGEVDASAAKLYDLIWKRTLASQMAEARFERTAADIEVANATFRANGNKPLFLGFLKVYDIQNNEDEAEAEGLLPSLAIGDNLKLLNLPAEQHFTEPPPRYSEASLVKMLEELGIGRPSTYAPTMSVIQDRGYVSEEERKFVPSQIGELVTDLLVEHFPSVIDYQFTAELEDELDTIADGKTDSETVLKKFYTPYNKLLKEKEHELKKSEITEEKTDEKCPQCGKDLVIKLGRFGKFFACSGYPECDYTAKLGAKDKPAAEPQLLDRKCPVCGEPLVKRVGKFGPFIGCSTFPKCTYIEQTENKIDVKCPKCTNPLVQKRTRRGRTFWGCSTYPKCDFATWDDPTAVPPSLEKFEADKKKFEEKKKSFKKSTKKKKE